MRQTLARLRGASVFRSSHHVVQVDEHEPGDEIDHRQRHDRLRVIGEPERVYERQRDRRGAVRE